MGEKMDLKEICSKIKKIRRHISRMIPVLMVGVFGSFLAIPEMNPERNIYYYIVGVFLFLISLCMFGLMVMRIRLNRYLSRLEQQEE